MADADQADDPILVQLRGNGPHLPGQLALGKYKIQMGQKNDVLLDHIRLFADGGGQGGEDPFDLFPLLGGPFADLVAELDDRQRLHKQGSARGTLILHDARDVGAEFGADGNHVPAVSDGDDGLLQILGHLAPDHLAELGADLLVGLGDVPADVVQGGAGVIGHFLFAQDRAGNVLLQLPEGLEPGGLGRDQRGVFPLGHQAASGGAGGPQGFRHQKEGLLRKGGALLRQGKIRPHVRKTAQRIAALIGQDDDGFFRFALGLLDFAEVRKRNQLAAFFLAQVGQGIICQLRENFIEFQHAECLFRQTKHLLSSMKRYCTPVSSRSSVPDKGSEGARPSIRSRQARTMRSLSSGLSMVKDKSGETEIFLSLLQRLARDVGAGA